VSRPAPVLPRRMPLGPVVAISVAAILLAGLATLAIISPVQPTSDSDCCIAGRPHRALVIVLDSTDPLIAREPRQVSAAVGAAVEALKPDDRVAMVELAGKAASEVTPLVNACLPGSETNVERNRLKHRILEPMARQIAEIGGRPEAPASPILETLLSLASDRTLNAPGARLPVLLVSDGLQNSPVASVYGRGVEFPSPASHPLDGVTVELVVLHNPRDARLQPRGVAKLVNWLKAAQAQVLYDPPRWLATGA